MKRYGLIGRTLKHSFSKTYFTNKFREEGLVDCSYENFELTTMDEFPLLFRKNAGIKGLNVTIPYKEEVIQYLTGQNEIVKAIGACNCIKVEGNDLIGYNTDVVGFQLTLEPLLRQNHTKALILGTGGASKAVRYVLDHLGIASQFVSRRKIPEQFIYEEVNGDVLSQFQLIINTTPAGMYPNVDEAPALPYDLLTASHFLFDLTYNPPKTKFLEEGERRGAQIFNGYQMLIEQAEEAWRIWNE